MSDNFDQNTTHPIDYFKLFFTDSIIDHIVKCTNDYAHIAINKKCRTKPNYVDPLWSLDGSDNLSSEELHAYLGCCVIFSVNPSRQLRHIFSSEPFLNNMEIHQIFTLCHFTKTSNYLCVSDKSLEPPRDSDAYDKMFKIRPIVEHLNKMFPQYFHYSGHVVLDKSTVAMKNRDNCKQYNPSKPAKWGWKVWSLCDGNDIEKPYLLSFSPYLGKKHTKVSKYGLYFDVVQKMTKPLRGSNVRLYTDSAYSSVRNLLYLKKHSIFVTCTVRQNSSGLHPSVKTCGKKMPRGYHKIFQDENDRLLTCCAWFDTKPVRFISTASDPTIVSFVLRRVGGNYECISQPAIAANYQSKYESVDIMDFFCSKYSMARCSYRPWKYMFNFCLQASIVNAHILYTSTNKAPRRKNYTQTDFRLTLGKQMIGSFSVCKYEPKLQPLFISPDASNERFINHENTRMPSQRGKVCRTHLKNFGNMQCTVYGCLSCNVHLCKRCHLKWHK